LTGGLTVEPAPADDVASDGELPADVAELPLGAATYVELDGDAEVGADEDEPEPCERERVRRVARERA
jgi:hypothetical protein